VTKTKEKRVVGTETKQMGKETQIRCVKQRDRDKELKGNVGGSCSTTWERWK